MMLGDWIDLAATVVQVAAILVTAVYATKSLNAWRKQLIGKRQIELAEEILTAAYMLREALPHVRNPGAFDFEGKGRPRDTDEPDASTMMS